MILAVLGVILIISGVLVVVRKTAETWAERRAAGFPKPPRNRRSPIGRSCS
jgi:hypothetical protein